MPTKPDDGPLFSQEAISAILKRAAEMQGAGDTDVPVGFSLTELQNIAAEAGIDPKYVAAAATEHSRSRTTNRHESMLVHTAELVIEGEISEEAWEAVVAEIRMTIGDTGVVTKWGRTNEWTHSGSGGVQAHVTATSTGGRTHVRAYWQTGVLAAAVFVPFSVLSIVLVPILFDSLALFTPAGVTLYAALVGMLFFLARWILGRLASSHKARLSGLMGRIESISAGDVRTDGSELSMAEDLRIEGSILEDMDPIPDPVEGRLERRRSRE